MSCLHLCGVKGRFIASVARAKEAEQKFSQLREVYQKLRGDHIQLLRQNGESKKQLAVAEKSVNDEKDERKVN